MVLDSLRRAYQRFTSKQSLPEYAPPPTTAEELDWADLPIIDFSTVNTADGRQTLAKQVSEALATHGFLYIVNHGYPPEQAKRIFSIASATFDLVDEKEKRKFDSKSDDKYEGYKPRQTWQIEKGVSDQIEHYSINRDVHSLQHPNVLKPYLDDIQEFAKFNHFNILFPVLRLLAIALELPEECLVEQHRFEDEGESSVRFMKYYPRSQDEEVKTRNVWLKGHTDIGSITILWSQPVSGLQILSKDGNWRYVKHIENGLVVNTGDAMQFLSGGFYKPTIHRVIQPPRDQAQLERLGVFYFAMTSDATKLTPHQNSPVLQREGIKNTSVDGLPASDAPTMAEWRKERTGKYGRTKLMKSKDSENVEEDIVLGKVVKEYN